MWRAARRPTLAACLLALASSLCWGEPAFVCFTAAEVEQIRRELEGMRLSVSVLRGSLETSGRESQALRTECGRLEGQLRRALTELEGSAAQLVQSSQRSQELETLLRTLRQEYEGLRQSYKRLKTEAAAWKAAAAVLAAVAAGMGAWALLDR